jgi:multidrug efflux pump subunit AcrA (membrane-fusion protein)
MKRHLPLWISILVAGAALHAAEPSVGPRKAKKPANMVILDEVGVKNLNLELVEATQEQFEDTIFALGRIETLPGKRAVLSSRIAGRALKVLAKPDHEVKAGDPLVVVESRQAGDPPPSVTLTAPISGFIIELAVAPGDPVSPDRPLLAIVDLSTVYALAAVPEHLADQIRRGQRARVTAPGWPGEVWETQVEHIGAMADATAGKIEAAFHINNEGLWLRPGMRVEFNLVTRTRTDVLAVPREAVQGEGADRFVFIQDISMKNAFMKAPVVIGAENDRFTEILQGVFEGDSVVTRGSYSLSFAGKGSVSLKEALDAAHGHEHNEDGSEIAPEQKAAGHTDHDGHDHESTNGNGISALTIFSLAGNAILLVLLGLKFAGRNRAEDRKTATTPEKTKREGAGHA